MRRTLHIMLLAALSVAPSAVAAQSLSAGFAVTDVGAPSPFGLSFSLPIAPLTGTVGYTFDGFLTLIDARGDGVSATPSALPEFFRLGVFDGSSWFVVDDIGGTSAITGAGTTTQSASGTFDCSAIGACTLMRLDVAFELSGNEDQLIGSGTFTLQPTAVPEPGTLALLGLGALGMFRRRRAA